MSAEERLEAMHAKHLALLLLGASLAGCGSPVSSPKSQAPLYDPAFAAPDANGVQQAAGFNVKFSSDSALGTLHRAPFPYGVDQDTSNFSTECRVDPEATLLSERDILCLLEIEELDLYFSEIKLTYNLPRNMCRYLQLTPYNFYGLQPGTGPSTLSYTLDTRTTPPTYTDTSSGTGGRTVQGQPVCDYNYTGSGGPNCCAGNYVVTTTTIVPAGADPIPPSSAAGTWGGSYGNCLAGPAMKTQTLTAQGIPRSTVFLVETTGLNATYTIPRTMGQTLGTLPIRSNLFAANFYNPGEHTTGGVSQGTVPDPALYSARPVGLGQAAGNNYLPSDTYEFSCLDGAEDMKYRIRVMIREWNKSPPVENCSLGTNCPDEGGVEDDPILPINDRDDWLDIGPVYPTVSNL